MQQKGKFLVTNEGSFDLGTYTWDDQLFSDILIRENPIDTDQALGISQSLREEISKLESGQQPVYKEYFVIQDLIREVFDSLYIKAQERNIKYSNIFRHIISESYFCGFVCD